MVNVVIVNELGFDGGGVAKLAIEFSKLGLPTLFRDTVQASQFKATDLGNIILYKDFNELEKIILEHGYNRIIFLQVALYKKELAKKILAIKELQTRLLNVEFCFIYCARKLNHWNDFSEELYKCGFQFDYYYSITQKLADVLTNCKYININAYTFPNQSAIVSYEDKQKIVFTAGRIEAIKGILAYFKCANYLIDGKYQYLHEGAKFNFNKNGNLSVTPQMLSLFDTNSSPKEIKFPFDFKEYDESADITKLTIYPSYPMGSRINTWSNYLVGICCTLGTISRCVKRKNLIEQDWIISDNREYKKICMDEKYWNDAVEYVTLEMISSGVPVLFSRKYAELLNFDDDRLIYNTYKDISKKVSDIDTKDIYDDVRHKQYMFFAEKQKYINENLIKEFLNTIK